MTRERPVHHGRTGTTGPRPVQVVAQQHLLDAGEASRSASPCDRLPLRHRLLDRVEHAARSRCRRAARPAGGPPTAYGSASAPARRRCGPTGIGRSPRRAAPASSRRAVVSASRPPRASTAAPPRTRRAARAGRSAPATRTPTTRTATTHRARVRPTPAAPEPRQRVARPRTSGQPHHASTLCTLRSGASDAVQQVAQRPASGPATGSDVPGGHDQRAQQGGQHQEAAVGHRGAAPRRPGRRRRPAATSGREHDQTGVGRQSQPAGHTARRPTAVADPVRRAAQHLDQRRDAVVIAGGLDVVEEREAVPAEQQQRQQPPAVASRTTTTPTSRAAAVAQGPRRPGQQPQRRQRQDGERRRSR